MHFVLEESTGKTCTPNQAHLPETVLSGLAALEQSNALLRHEKAMADAANQAKSAFLAQMSHEIRTPIHVVLNSLNLTLNTELTDEQREYLSLMQLASSSLLSLINNILDLSRIEAGHLDIEHIPFSLHEMLGDTLKMLGLEARLKGLALAVDISPAVPDMLLGDPHRLRQIVVNLVANAIKFSRQGKIVVRVALESGDAQQVCCHFTISDNGIGIPLDKQAIIFNPYRQADAGTVRASGGSGLGLSIAAHLVELMQGSIWVNSTPGSGSTFHFTVCCGRPLASFSNAQPKAICNTPSSPRRKRQDPASSLPARTILLVEDNPMNRRLTQAILDKAGYRVLLAESGRQALSVLADAACDLVLMDMDMADMDGTQTTAAIRQCNHPDLPIIALTGHALPDDRERCLQAGMDAYLTKPLQPEALLAVIAELTSKQPQQRIDQAIDKTTLLNRVNGDMNLLREIRELFLRDYPQRMADIRHALDERDPLLLTRSLHTLSGMFRSLAASTAYEMTQTLEALPAENAWPQAGEIFQHLESEVKRLETSLTEMIQSEPVNPAMENMAPFLVPQPWLNQPLQHDLRSI